MRHLRWISYALTASGILLASVAILTGLGAGVLLTGVLLAWAGAVKIAVVAIWSTIARLDSDRHRDRMDQLGG